ncbi:hypothetical protein M3Y99_00442300 [Aphelenchoides fujianensis]|nr:hypothetical protein M3Y99_00442300 [Aphelenchoides fujianensis]
MEITGRGVDVKQTVVHGGWGGPIVFLTVDIDVARALVVDNAVHPSREAKECEFVAEVSKDGRELGAIHEEDPKTIQVYSLAERKWTQHELQGLKKGNNFDFWFRFSPSGRIYVQGPETDNCEFLFRCDVDQKKWERVPLEAGNYHSLTFIVNSDNGREDGVVIREVKELPANVLGQTVERFRIERRMFRNPDSLLRQSFVAVQKLRQGVYEEEVIRELLQ